MILLTHYIDLDGVGSIVLSKFAGIEYERIVGLEYSKDNQDLEIVKEISDKSKMVIVTDYRLNQELYDLYNTEFLDYLVFDHHEQSIPFNDESKIFADLNRCGTKLFYDNMISASIKNDASDYFVELVNTYDLWKKDSPLWEEASNLNRVLWSTTNFLYPEKDFDRHNVFIGLQLEKLKRNEFGWTNYELDKINFQKVKEKQAVDKAVEVLQVREDNRGYKFGLYWGKHKISFVCNSILENQDDLNYIVNINTYQPNGKESVSGKVSVRSKEDFDVTNLSGIEGHKNAGGGNFTLSFLTNLWNGRILQIPYKRKEV